MSKTATEQIEQIPIEELYPEALSFISDVKSKHLSTIDEISDIRKQKWNGLDEHIKASPLAGKIQKLLKGYENYKNSLKRRFLFIKALGITESILGITESIVTFWNAVLYFGTDLQYRTPEYVKALTQSYIGLFLGIAAVYGLPILYYHKKAGESKEELILSMGPERFEDKMRLTKNLYDNVPWRYLNLEI